MVYVLFLVVLIQIAVMNDQFKDIQPLTKGMLECLMDCHERELMNLAPNDATIKYAVGLLRRRLLTSRVFKNSKGKNHISLYTTQLGRDYLDTIK